MTDRRAGCMGNPLVRFCEGQGYNYDMDEILWHRRESRRQRRKQTSSCHHGSPLSTRKYGNTTAFTPVLVHLLVHANLPSLTFSLSRFNPHRPGAPLPRLGCHAAAR